MISNLVRIQKLLAEWGVGSRRTIESLIDEKRISVDGKTVLEQGLKIDPNNSVICLDGETLKPNPVLEPIILALHKPSGFVTTLRDQFGRPTIKQLINNSTRLYPIGRLDIDSTGLLLLTNFGELANRLLHPKHKVEKEYLVTIRDSVLSKTEETLFSGGIALPDGVTAPCSIEHIAKLTYRIILREGRKRQIKRMFAALDRNVTRLHRIRFGPILLGKLPAGKTRPLHPREIGELLSITGLDYKTREVSR